MASGEVILELHRVGTALKVTAVDPETLIEISFQAPAATPMPSLRQLAAAKLACAVARARSRS
jgi:hypothetical protein